MSVGLVIFLTLFFLLFWHLVVSLKTDDSIPIELGHEADSGDVILFRNSKYDEIPFLNTRIVSHVALVWKTEIGVMVVDINPTLYGPYKNGDHIVVRGAALVVYPLEFALRKYPGAVFLRRLRKAMTLEQREKLAESIDWAMKLRYDDTIASRDSATYVSIALSTLLPELSVYVAELTALSLCRTSIFCTELVSELLRRSDVLPSSVSHVYGPISWMSRVQDGVMSALWSPEVQLVWY